MLFNRTEPHFCPICPPFYNKKGMQIAEPLKLRVENYSGCGVDFAVCATCGRTFQISYKIDVDNIIDITKELEKSSGAAD